jgi:hypothetical protein
MGQVVMSLLRKLIAYIKHWLSRDKCMGCIHEENISKCHSKTHVCKYLYNLKSLWTPKEEK